MLGSSHAFRCFVVRHCNVILVLETSNELITPRNPFCVQPVPRDASVPVWRERLGRPLRTSTRLSRPRTSREFETTRRARSVFVFCPVARSRPWERVNGRARVSQPSTSARRARQRPQLTRLNLSHQPRLQNVALSRAAHTHARVMPAVTRRDRAVCTKRNAFGAL